jgi:hypothetical protein
LRVELRPRLREKRREEKRRRESLLSEAEPHTVTLTHKIPTPTTSPHLTSPHLISSAKAKQSEAKRSDDGEQPGHVARRPHQEKQNPKR